MNEIDRAIEASKEIAEKIAAETEDKRERLQAEFSFAAHVVLKKHGFGDDPSLIERISEAAMNTFESDLTVEEKRSLGLLEDCS